MNNGRKEDFEEQKKKWHNTTYKERGSYEKEKSKTDTGNAAFPGADYNNRYIPISNGFCNNGPKYFYILIEYCISPNK